MEDQEYIEMDEKTVKDQLGDKPLVDLGTVTIADQREQQLLDKYVETLKEGDETYKPADLVFKKTRGDRS